MPPAPPCVDILGVPVARLDLEGTVAYLDRALDEGQRIVLITANPEFIMLARRELALGEPSAPAVRLIVPDGVGLVLASRLLGAPLTGRARGRDLVLRLADVAERRRLSLYLLGAGEGVAARAAAVLAREVDGLRIAGTYSGSAEPAADDDSVPRVAATRPDILLVAYGMPKQELWISRNLERLPSVRVAVGVGGAFDYLVGDAPLPPEWLARAGLEWLWRLIRQPWRWRRQLVLPVFLWLVLRERLARAA